jgi:hypothetical protein
MTSLIPSEVVTVTFPVTCSEAFGLKVTFITAFCPDASELGAEMPLTEKSLALTVIPEMVREVLPVLVMVTFVELELPAFTFGKLRLVGVEERLTVPAIPIPLKDAVFGELEALLVMLILPDRLPAVVGANKTLKVALAPGASVAGVESPLTLYAAPVTDNCAMVRAAVPVLVTVNF